MSDILSIHPFAEERVTKVRYDAWLATVGYERRARHASQKLRPEATRRIACAFADRKVGSFTKNLEWFEGAGFELEEVQESDVEEWATRWVEQICSGTTADDVIRIAVDVSSMSRLRIASLLAALMRLPGTMRVAVDFLYSIAKWSPPSEEPEPIVYAGAVLPFFAGWSSRPELPTVALIGLGYEPDKAVGAYEYLEATRVWAFVPVSLDSRYTRDIGRANESLFGRIPQKQQMSYQVDQPFACFGTIESIVYGESTASRPVLLPFGPKIFALCAMLVACVHRDVPVWRISSGQFGDAVDRIAEGTISGIRVLFGPSQRSGEYDDAVLARPRARQQRKRDAE